jgi:hypothetical protein
MALIYSLVARQVDVLAEYSQPGSCSPMPPLICPPLMVHVMLGMTGNYTTITRSLLKVLLITSIYCAGRRSIVLVLITENPIE